VLVNNAGISPISKFDELRVDDWDEMIDVNINPQTSTSATSSCARPRRAEKKIQFGQLAKHVATSSHDVLDPHAVVFAFAKHPPASGCARHLSHFASGAVGFGFLQSVSAQSVLQAAFVSHAQASAVSSITAAASGSSAEQHLKQPPSVKSAHDPESGVGVPESIGAPLSIGAPVSLVAPVSSALPVSAMVASVLMMLESSELLPPHAPTATIDAHETPTIKTRRGRFILSRLHASGVTKTLFLRGLVGQSARRRDAPKARSSARTDRTRNRKGRSSRMPAWRIGSKRSA
jgi:hypothetical protein